MHWPRKIHTREMLTKETHAAEKFPTLPNTFLMVRFKCCFSMNIISVIQFVLKVFFNFSLSTLVMAKFMSSICVDLGAHSFFPTPHSIISLFWKMVDQTAYYKLINL